MYFKMTWDDWYKLAEIYYRYHGNLKIKQKFSTINGYEYDSTGYKLGSWLNNQRQRYKDGLLTDEQKKNLELLGMNFETTHEFRWDRMYELAKSYYEHYGNLKVHQKFRTFNGYTYDENGYKLGIWVADQRFHYKSGVLSAERIERLKSINFVLGSLRDVNWDEMYKLAQGYYEHYGHLKIPNDFKTENGYQYSKTGKNLGSWITTQREYYINGNLSDKHTEKLIQIGMFFTSVHQKEWEEMYGLAKVYYECYGNLRIKRGFRTIDGFMYDKNGSDLHSWLEYQRRLYKQNKLSEERIERLKRIGMLFSVKKNINLNIALCKEYDIDYEANKTTVDSIAYRELMTKINYLNSLGIPLTINNQLHPIFIMGNINMQANYGISLEILFTKYFEQDKKTKTI